MQLFICIALFFAIGTVVSASSSSSSIGSVNSDKKQDFKTEVQNVQTEQQDSDYNRFKKSAGYGGAASAYVPSSIPAPPCPKNYLFSCQPNLAPVPCSAPAYYGSAAAYSVPVPTYAAPLESKFGTPQVYNGYVPQTFNQFYQY